MSASMRLKAGVVLLGIIFLLVSNLRFDGLPFIPDSRFSDAAVTHWPSALFLRESMLEGRGFPLWRETIMAGQPFAANSLNKTAYPLQWLVLVFPPALHLNILIIFHLLLAGAGMWMWTRAMGLRAEASAFSALAYALNPKIVAHLGAGHLDILYALAWWPWLMWSVHQGNRGIFQFVGTNKQETSDFTTVPQGGFAQTQTAQRNSSNTEVRFILRTGMIGAMTFLGDVRVGLLALALAGAYEIWGMAGRRWSVEKAERGQYIAPLRMTPSQVVDVNLRYILKRLWVLAPFFMLTLAALLPLIGWRPYLNRANLTAEEAGVFSLEIGHFMGLALPAHEGNFETITYLGLPVLVLALIAVVSAPRKHIFWLGAAVVALLYALGENGFLWPLLVQVIPALLWLRVPSRAWFVVILIVCLLAGYGLESVLRFVERLREGIIPAQAKRWRLLVVGMMAGLVACGAFTLLALPLPGSVGLSVLLVGGALGVVLLVALSGRVSSQYLFMLLLGLTFFDLLWTGTRWLEWRGTDTWLEAHSPLAEQLVAEDANRIYSPTYSLEQQVAAAYDLRLFGGVDPFQLSAVSGAISQGGGVQPDGYSVVQPPLIGLEGDDLSSANRDAVIDTRILAQWGVSHVVSAYEIENPELRLSGVVDGVYFYQNEAYAAASNGETISNLNDFPGRNAVRPYRSDDNYLSLFSSLHTLESTIPDWPTEWQGLPDEATVRRLNQMTMLAALVSGIGWVVCSGWLIMLERRVKD